jgi:hypothetical protein
MLAWRSHLDRNAAFLARFSVVNAFRSRQKKANFGFGRQWFLLFETAMPLNAPGEGAFDGVVVGLFKAFSHICGSKQHAAYRHMAWDLA